MGHTQREKGFRAFLTLMGNFLMGKNEDGAKYNQRCVYGYLHDEMEKHTCPFQEGVNKDDHFLCQCCSQCQEDCRSEI